MKLDDTRKQNVITLYLSLSFQLVPGAKKSNVVQSRLNYNTFKD